MRTIILSDIHIGDPRYNTRAIIDTLASETFDGLVLNGDIIDIWLEDIENIKKDPLVKVIQTISKRKNVHWVLGNHDINSDIFGENVSVSNSLEFNHDAYKFLIVHGNEVYPNKNNSKLERFMAKISAKLYEWFGLDMQHLFRKTSLYKNKSRKMRIKLLEKYNKKYNYIIMGHTHQIDYISYDKTALLDVGCPHTTNTFALVEDGRVYIRRINGCAKN